MKIYNTDEILPIIKNLQNNEIKTFYFLPLRVGAQFNQHTHQINDVCFYPETVTPFYLSIKRIDENNFYHMSDSLLNCFGSKFLNENEIERKVLNEAAAVPYMDLSNLVYNTVGHIRSYYDSIPAVMSNYKRMLMSREDLQKAFDTTMDNMCVILDTLKENHPEYIL